MKDAKVNMNRPPLSEKEINKAKDFNSLMNQYDEPPIKIKWGKIGGIIAIVAGVVGYVIWPVANGGVDNAEYVNSQDSLAVQSFFKNTELPMTEYLISAELGDSIYTANGTLIIIPPNSLVDDKGNGVSGDVVISFREFHDVPTIFGSNVAMTYDSAGSEYHFESAGMIEIYGNQNDKELSIRKENPVIVEMLSHNPGDYFNVYYMDPKGDWEFVKKDISKVFQRLDSQIVFTPISLEDHPALQTKAKDYNKAKKQYNSVLQNAGLVIPKLANDNQFSIKLNYSEEEFPELKGYENVLFEVTNDNKNFDPKIAEQTWTDIDLSKEIDGRYKMLLFGKKKIELIVTPVFSSDDIEKANQNFESLFKKYDLAHQKVLSDAKNKMIETYSKYKTTEDSILNIVNSSLNESAWNSEIDSRKDAVIRVFTVEKFGFWNSDCPQSLPSGLEVTPVFVNEDNIQDTLTFVNLYIAEYNKEAFFTLWGSWGNFKRIDSEGNEKKEYTTVPFSFNPENPTVVWAVTNKGSLAVIQPEQLIEMTKGKNQKLVVLKMKLHDKIGVIKDIKKALDWQ